MEYGAKLVVSLDLELFWGARTTRSLEECRDELLAARRAVPALLDLFSEFGVRVTWPVVGFLFCDSREELLESLPGRLPTYRQAVLSPYAHIARIGESEADDPVHFAPGLIDEIAGTPGHEIGCHTFSNFFCGASGTSPEEFESDLQAAIEVARRKNIMLRSLAIPRNYIHPDLLSSCRRMGFSAYRGAPPAWPYTKKSDGRQNSIKSRLRRWIRRLDGLVPVTGTRCVAGETSIDRVPVNVPATRRFRPFAGRNRAWLARLQRRRILTELDGAARSGGLFHLWARIRDFGRGLTDLRDELRKILERFAAWRRLGDMESVTMHEVVTGPGFRPQKRSIRRAGDQG